MGIRLPVEFEFGCAESDLEVRVQGSIELSDVVEFYNALRAHPRCRRQLRVLADCVQADLRSFSAAKVWSIVKLSREQSPLDDVSVVAIAAPNPIAYGLLRMFELMRNPPYRMSVFRTRPAAVAWLAEPA